jgi:hypothetical protein
MESEGTNINRLSERRFGSIIFLLRSAGIPFQMKKISTIYALYMTTLIVSGFATYIGLLFNGYLHWDDLGRAMTAMRVLIPVTNVMWLYTYCRYVINSDHLCYNKSGICLGNSIRVTVIFKTKTKCVTEDMTPRGRFFPHINYVV